MAVNEVLNALKPSQIDSSGQLHVVNGMSTTTSSSLTTAARENVVLDSGFTDGLPGQPRTSIHGCALRSHPEVQNDDQDPGHFGLTSQGIAPQRIVTPSLATLEKAVAARIYFENLYFPLFRHPPSREQRKESMERDMIQMQLNQAQKEFLRARWRKNESDYLRERRQKVDVSAFVKLKTIGHGWLFSHLMWLSIYFND
jgi:protein-serine/threonine kinase